MLEFLLKFHLKEGILISILLICRLKRLNALFLELKLHAELVQLLVVEILVQLVLDACLAVLRLLLLLVSDVCELGMCVFELLLGGLEL